MNIKGEMHPLTNFTMFEKSGQLLDLFEGNLGSQKMIQKISLEFIKIIIIFLAHELHENFLLYSLFLFLLPLYNKSVYDI